MVDKAGKFPVVPVLDPELEPEVNAGSESVIVPPPELLAESAAELADEPDDAAEVAVPDDAVGMATLPELERVGRLD